MDLGQKFIDIMKHQLVVFPPFLNQHEDHYFYLNIVCEYLFSLINYSLKIDFDHDFDPSIDDNFMPG